MSFYRFAVAIPTRNKALIAWLEAQSGSRNALVIKALENAMQSAPEENRLEEKLDRILAMLAEGGGVSRPSSPPPAAVNISSVVLKNMLAEIDDE